MSTLAHNKRSYSKKWKIHVPKFNFGAHESFYLFLNIAFFRSFSGAKNLARFCRMPFSTFANIKGSLPTKSTRPGRLRCRTKTDSEDFRAGFGQFFFEHRHEKSVFKRSGS